MSNKPSRVSTRKSVKEPCIPISADGAEPSISDTDPATILVGQKAVCVGLGRHKLGTIDKTPAFTPGWVWFRCDFNKGLHYVAVAKLKLLKKAA